MKFIKSASSKEGYINDSKKEICFIGRSNVGKSSLINALANNKTLAKTSSTPGRTQLVNFYDDGDYRLVDLPGYGFAKLSKSDQTKIKNMIEEYIVNAKNLCAIFQICDANVITVLDAQMCSYFQENINNFYIILNKTDKQSISKYTNNLDKIAEHLNVDEDKIFFASAKNKYNINTIAKKIKEIIYEK